jgi:hypothetical protein
MGAYRKGTGVGQFARGGAVQRALVVGVLLVCALTPVALAASTSRRSPIKWGHRYVIDPPEGTNNSLRAVSCPSKSLCATVGNSGDVVVSTKPTGGSSAWKRKNVDNEPLLSVSCQPTHPSKPANWSSASSIDGTNAIEGMSCPSTSLCVAVDSAGQVLTSTHPTGGLPAWTPVSVDPGNVLNAVSCHSKSFCVAVDNHGNSVSSKNPTGGASAWTLHTGVASDDLAAVSCPSTKLCVAIDQTAKGGDVLTSTKPTSDKAWKVQAVDSHFRTPFGLSCASTSLCVMLDDNGYAFTSENPTGGKSAWVKTIHKVDNRWSFYAVSCSPGKSTVCVGVDQGGDEVAGKSRH